jgi:hypothetical protein
MLADLMFAFASIPELVQLRVVRLVRLSIPVRLAEAALRRVPWAASVQGVQIVSE